LPFFCLPTLTPFAKGLEIDFSYQVTEHIKYLPRIGLEFAVDKKYSALTYTGFGPSESYVDKRLDSVYGTYDSTVKKEYFPWIKPQESGSHWGSTQVEIKNCCKITAQEPFSFSALPY
jgi:beta-galactosidase